MRSLSHKQRFYLLLAGGMLLLVISWFSAIENTFDLYIENTKLKERLTKAGDAPQQIEALQGQLAKLENNISISAGNKNQEEILEEISSFCENNQVRLQHFPRVERSSKLNYTVLTHVIEVEGRFTNIVKLIWFIEQEKRSGRVSSVKFQKYRNRKTKREHLKATIYLQNIQTHENV